MSECDQYTGLMMKVNGPIIVGFVIYLTEAPYGQRSVGSARVEIY